MDEELKRRLITRMANYTNNKNVLHRFERDLDLLEQQGRTQQKIEDKKEFGKIIDKLNVYVSKDTEVYMPLVKSRVRLPNKMKLINKEELKSQLSKKEKK